MKIRKWPYLVMIGLCLAAFYGYRAAAASRADTEAPKITLDSQLLEVSVEDDRSALLQGVTARDDRDGDVTASLLVENVRLLDGDGTITVTYAAFDSAGNASRAERQARYTDYQSPRFTLSAPLIFTQNASFDLLSIVGAEDALDGDIQHRIRATSLDESAVSTLGTHKVQFRVTNSLGDTVEAIFPVEVLTAGDYDGSLTLTEYMVYVPVGGTFRADVYPESFTANRQTFSLEKGYPEGFDIRSSGRVDTSTPGVYVVTYEYIYTPESEGNSRLVQKYSGYSKLIVVVEG